MTNCHSDAAVIRLRGISRAFDLVPAVSRVDLEVAAGEVLQVRGPNGAGKSTLLRIIATALSPTAGTGRVLGFDLMSDREEIRRQTELLSHRTRLYEDLTAMENLRFTAAINRVDHGLAPGALERVGLARFSRETVRGFSQGMRQRLALARVVMRRPELLLLDEPYAGLDREAQGLVDELVTDARRNGRTVVIVSHGGAGADLASRTVVMRAGRLYSTASAQAAVAKEA
jgi:heme ABC exporter ATP-binding subunit CcmA